MKVVIVDDSAAERKLCRLLLEEGDARHLEFFEAATAADGLEMIRELNPDCILLDYRLPDMTGLEFLARLSDARLNGGAGVRIAVVMFTGVTSGQIAVDAMKAGAQDYLVKDRINAESLGLAIQKATQKISLMHTLEAERDRLARSLAEKEVLLQEVHHRVKNNLQVVASLLRLQAEDLGGLGAEALRESQTRVESMAMIHEQLYESGDLRGVNLAEHASQLIHYLLHAYGASGRIRGRVDMQPLVLEVDQAIPAGLILNELVSNALKHAFPGGRSGQIAVEGGLSNGRIALAVRDDGAGLPKDFVPGKTTSLGLRIVQILSRQLKGALEVERTGGTTFRVSFEAPARTTEPGSDRGAGPVRAFEAPARTTEPGSEGGAGPVRAFEAPARTTEPGSDRGAGPVRAFEAPARTTEPGSEGGAGPVRAFEAPARTTEPGSEGGAGPVRAFEAPARTTEPGSEGGAGPVRAFEAPARTTEPGSEGGAGPVRAFEAPARTTEPGSDRGAGPVRAFEAPARTTEPGSDRGAGPVRAFEAPMGDDYAAS